MVNIEKIDTSSIKEKALSMLENKILSGEFSPGDRLPPERDIAAAMGISRGIISMCMLKLEAKGFVKIVPRQGTFVNDYLRNGTPEILTALMNYDSNTMDLDLFESMMETRRLIEYECIRLAIKNRTEEDIQLLTIALEKMEMNKGEDSFRKFDFEFHHILAGASGNAVYAMILKSFEKTILYFNELYFTDLSFRIESIKQHQSLLEAIKLQNYKNAEKAIKYILDEGVIGLSKIYKKIK